MKPSPILSASALSVGYRKRSRGRAVLSGIDVAVSAGEMVCLLGENGVGKSTLLRTLAGLQAPLSGTVRVNGKDLAAIRPMERARLIGVVLSERIAVGALRARQMVALGRYAHSNWAGSLSADDDRAIDKAISSVGASHLAERDCRELSDGERQRLNLARVLAQEPKVIVLDEPTAFLDVASRVELMALLRHLAREVGIAVLASSHDIDLALRNADTAWLLSPDRTLHCGVPEDLIAAGIVSDTFAAGRLQLDIDSLSFRPIPTARRTATIVGPPFGSKLAATLLEREGFRQTNDGAFIVEIVDDSGIWRIRRNGTALSGTSYAALATSIRQLAPEATERETTISLAHITKG